MNRWARAGITAASLAGAMLTLLSVPAPLVVINPTGSLPIGLYRLSGMQPEIGSIALFSPPAAARDYKPFRAGEEESVRLLKPIVGLPGMTVCAREGVVSVGGQHYRQMSVDSGGLPLPRFNGCRELAAGELFGVSSWIPNSFDSRYFGPIQLGDVFGYYEPLWTPAFLQGREL